MSFFIERLTEEQNLNKPIAVCKKFIRNKSITINCKFLILLIDTYPNDKISLKQLFEDAYPLSKQQVLDLIEEAKMHGYLVDGQS